MKDQGVLTIRQAARNLGIMFCMLMPKVSMESSCNMLICRANTNKIRKAVFDTRHKRISSIFYIVAFI